MQGLECVGGCKGLSQYKCRCKGLSVGGCKGLCVCGCKGLSECECSALSECCKVLIDY